MLVHHDRHTCAVADTLRAVGALLDAHRAGGVLLHETDAGLILRAHVAPCPGMPPDTRRIPLERVFGHQEILAQRLESMARRGSGHRAGPIEWALRNLGILIETDDLWEFTIAEQPEGAWLLWYRCAHSGAIGSRAVDHDELERIDAVARERARHGVVADDALVGV